MKKLTRILACSAFTAFICLAVSACGKPNVEVTTDLDATFQGYNGFGTMTLEGQDEWIDDVLELYKDNIKNDSQAIKLEYELRDLVEFSFSPEEGLSNGDTVTVTADIGKKVEELGFTLSAKEVTFTVEGLEEIKESTPLKM